MTQAKVVAYYLPQFHAVPENDEWWGVGFTEWTNVRRALPLFDGHDHPRVPTDLGYYDLSSPAETFRQQIDMARAGGVSAFCFYHYWFDGHRILESPVDWFRNGISDFEYCLSWANEPWTRRWDGKDHDVLMPQTYGGGFATGVFESWLPHFRRENYLRHGGRPVLVVHRVDQIPNPREAVAIWRSLAEQSGLGDLYLVAAETTPGLDPRVYGFDAVAEFPPVGSNTLASAYLRPLTGIDINFRGRLLSYERMAARFEGRRDVPFVRHRGVAPGWDNTARRGLSATIYIGSSPSRFAKWLRSAVEKESSARGPSGLVFVNAWNEWAEGAYLEPDQSHGGSHLGLEHAPIGRPPVVTHQLLWGRGQMRSIAMLTASAGLATARRVRNRLRAWRAA